MNSKNKTTYKLLTVIVLLLLLVIFTLQNTQKVEVSFFFWSISISSTLLILISLILGMFIGWLGIPSMQKRWKKIKEKEEEI